MDVTVSKRCPSRSVTLSQAIELAERKYDSDEDVRCVMVANGGSFLNEIETRRHVKMFRDEHGIYVRLGKHGAQKRYLHDMVDARVVHVDGNIVVFYET